MAAGLFGCKPRLISFVSIMTFHISSPGLQTFLYKIINGHCISTHELKRSSTTPMKGEIFLRWGPSNGFLYSTKKLFLKMASWIYSSFVVTFYSFAASTLEVERAWVFWAQGKLEPILQSLSWVRVFRIFLTSLIWELEPLKLWRLFLLQLTVQAWVSVFYHFGPGEPKLLSRSPHIGFAFCVSPEQVQMDPNQGSLCWFWHA